MMKPNPIESSSRRDVAMIVIGVWLLAFVIYAGSIKHGWVFDDKVFIVHAKCKTFADVPRYFTTGHHGLYRPLRAFQYAAAHTLFGLKPAGYRIYDFFIYGFCSAMVALIALGLGASKPAAFLCGSLFAVHPVHVDRVANATAGFDILGVALLFAALAAYLSWSKRGDMRGLVVVTALFALALLSSEEAATFLLLIVLHRLVFPDHYKEAAFKRGVSVIG